MQRRYPDSLMIEQLIYAEGEAAGAFRVHQYCKSGLVRTEPWISGQSLHGVSIASGYKIGPALCQSLQRWCWFFRIDQCEAQRIGITTSGFAPPDSVSTFFFSTAFSRLERLAFCPSHLYPRRSGKNLEIIRRCNRRLMPP